ncbi:MAG: amidohydrolase family protein [Verrucomicrobiae bacterium]|nr:amidohydrolase family protein [Verrucomicrobiae bacterium]
MKTNRTLNPFSFGGLLSAALLAATIPSVTAADAPAKEADPQVTLFVNVNVFDGVNEKLIRNANVVVTGNKITSVSTQPLAVAGGRVIDGGGRTLMPGLIYMHEHIMFQLPSAAQMEHADDRYMAIVATTIAKKYLDRGITTIRDAAGNSYGLKQAIDQGLVPGPRIFPAGPMISQTSGHADFRVPTDPTVFAGGRHGKPVERGDLIVADGVDEVLRATRETLRRGSSQIKIAVGGGTGSQSDPLEVAQYLPEEITAIVKAAEDFGTYVMAHVYNTDGIRRAVDAGVKSIEHGNLIDKETLQYMKEKDVWLSPQVTVYTYIPGGYTEDQARKHRQAYAGIDAMFTTAKEIGFKNIVMASDIIADPKRIDTILNELELRSKWFTPVETLRQATSNAGKLLALSNVMNPYKQGKLGVIEEGAYADLLLVEGNPLEDIAVATDPKNFRIIMKDGAIYKNSLK